MDQGKLTIDFARQEGRIFIIGLHHQSAALEVSKVLRQGECDARPSLCKSSIRNRVFTQVLHERNPRIFDAPQFIDGVALKRG
jgi:hypothetical protein